MFDFPASPVVGQVFTPAGGATWQWDGTTWKTTQMQGEMLIQRTFISGASGAATNYTYNKPANLRHLEFEGVAAGGSGSSAIATGAATWSHGSGGGGGAWGRKLFTAAALPASVALVIGAAGAAQSGSGGPGFAAADTTFGSLITLPGGRGGAQGANVTYTAGGSSAVSSGATAMPTGVDVGKPGEPSDPTSVSMNVGTTTNGTWGLLGRSGGSPWGAGAVAAAGTGYGPATGVGYGFGSSGNINAASAAVRNSVVGGPGAVLLTEYLAVAPADVIRPARQTFTPSGGGALTIPVPVGAQMAKINGKVWQTANAQMTMRLSVDGSTFFSGASDYAYSGIGLFGGSTTSPMKVAHTATTGFVLTNSSDSTIIPHLFDVDVVTLKSTAAQLFTAKWRGMSYYSIAGNLIEEYLFAGYLAAAPAVTQLAAIQIFPSAGNFGAGSSITVDWIY